MSKFGENVFKSTSINFGTKPDCTIGHSDVDQQSAGFLLQQFQIVLDKRLNYGGRSGARR